jgi:membrane-bound ClpP family serine protease
MHQPYRTAQFGPALRAARNIDATAGCPRLAGTADQRNEGNGVADDAVIGQVGEVCVRVRGSDKPGEIVATVHGIRETFIAYADTPLERGERVLVIATRGPRQVDVVAWSG